MVINTEIIFIPHFLSRYLEVAGFIAQLQMPWTSHRPIQHSVGLFVINEFLSFGVPSESAAQPYGNIVQMADCIGANSGFNRTNRFLPGLDALEKIATVVVTLRQVNLIGANASFQ
jgi:hypothetical protein